MAVTANGDWAMHMMFDRLRSHAVHNPYTAWGLSVAGMNIQEEEENQERGRNQNQKKTKKDARRYEGMEGRKEAVS